MFEKDVGLLPEFMKNALFACGLASPIMIKWLTEEDIANVEEFVRMEMSTMYPLTDEYFHIFSSQPSEFQFVLGHKKTLSI